MTKFRKKTNNKKSISKLINKTIYNQTETKVYSPNQNNATVSTSGYLVSLSDMDRGTHQFERVGSMIYIDNIRLRFLLENQDQENLMRVAILRSLKSDLVLGDLPTSSVLQPFDPNKVFIYYDKVFNMKDTETGSGSYTKSKIFREVFKKIKARSRFDNSDNVIHGGIYLFVRSDSGAPNHPAISWYSRTVFKDA